ATRSLWEFRRRSRAFSRVGFLEEGNEASSDLFIFDEERVMTVRAVDLDIGRVAADGVDGADEMFLLMRWVEDVGGDPEAQHRCADTCQCRGFASASAAEIVQVHRFGQ